MNKYVNRWIKVKMTKRNGDGFYMANQCPVCDAESVVQTNACSNCGTMLKGYKVHCVSCNYYRCDRNCEKCSMFKGQSYEHICCICRKVKHCDLCPYYEAAD